MILSNNSSLFDYENQIDIISFLETKKYLKIKINDNKKEIFITPNILIKILTQADIYLYENISKLINFEIKYSNFSLLSKEELIWMKIPSYKIYFGIFGFNCCQIEGKEIEKISSMIFPSFKNMTPYIKVSLLKNSSIYLSKSNTFRSLYSDRNNLTNSLIMKNELMVTSNMINNSISVELIEVTDILGKSHKILKDHLDFAKEQLYLEKIDIKNVIIDFYDFPDNNLFSIHKKWLVKEKLIFPIQKKHYVISVAKIKMKNNKK